MPMSIARWLLDWRGRLVCCSAPPEGRTRWTVSLLADRLVELKVFESVSASTVMSKQCLDRRIATIRQLRSLLAAWQASRTSGKVAWRFTTADSRIKLRRFYPSIQ
jgi:hypothetical protein